MPAPELPGHPLEQLNVQPHDYAIEKMIDRVFVGSLDSEKAIVQKMVHDLLNNDPSPVNQEMKRTSEQSKKLAELRQKYLQYRSILQKKVMFMSEQMKIFPGDDDMHERIIRNQNSTTTGGPNQLRNLIGLLAFLRQDFEEKNNTKQSLPSSTKAFLAMFFSEIVEETAEAIQFLQFEGKWYRITHAGERLDKMTGKIEEFEKAQRKSLEDKLKKGVRTLQERLDKKYPNNLDEKQQKAKVREYNAARDKLIREHNKAVKELYEKYPEEKTAAKRKAKIERLDTRLEHAIKDAQKRLIKEFGPRAPRVENVLKWMYRSPLGKELWTKLLAVETPVTLLIFATYAYMTPNKLQAAMNMAGFLAASRLSSATQRTLNNAMMKFAKKRGNKVLMKMLEYGKSTPATFTITMVALFAGAKYIDQATRKIDENISDTELKYLCENVIGTVLFWDPLYTLGHEGLERAGIMTIDPEEDDISYLMREHTVNSPSKFFEREQFHTAEDYNARIDQVNNKVDNPILRDLFDLEKINVNSYWKSQQLLTIQTQSEILSDQLSQLYHALDAPGLFEDENWKEELEITRTARGVVAEKFIQNIEKRDDLTAHQETSEGEGSEKLEEIEKEGKELIAQLAKLDVQIALLEERQEASYLPNIREHGEFGLDTQGKDQLFDELRFLYDMTLAGDDMWDGMFVYSSDLQTPEGDFSHEIAPFNTTSLDGRNDRAIERMIDYSDARVHTLDTFIRGLPKKHQDIKNLWTSIKAKLLEIGQHVALMRRILGTGERGYTEETWKRPFDAPNPGMWEGVITEKQEKQEPKEQSQATQAFSAALLKNMDYNIKRTEALEYQPTRDDSIVSYSRDLVAILKPYRPDATGTSSGAWYSDAAEFFNEGRDLFGLYAIEENRYYSHAHYSLALTADYGAKYIQDPEKVQHWLQPVRDRILASRDGMLVTDDEIASIHAELTDELMRFIFQEPESIPVMDGFLGVPNGRLDTDGRAGPQIDRHFHINPDESFNAEVYETLDAHKQRSEIFCRFHTNIMDGEGKDIHTYHAGAFLFPETHLRNKREYGYTTGKDSMEEYVRKRAGELQAPLKELTDHLPKNDEYRIYILDYLQGGLIQLVAIRATDPEARRWKVDVGHAKFQGTGFRRINKHGEVTHNRMTMTNQDGEIVWTNGDSEKILHIPPTFHTYSLEEFFSKYPAFVTEQDNRFRTAVGSLQERIEQTPDYFGLRQPENLVQDIESGTFAQGSDYGKFFDDIIVRRVPHPEKPNTYLVEYRHIGQDEKTGQYEISAKKLIEDESLFQREKLKISALKERITKLRAKIENKLYSDREQQFIQSVRIDQLSDPNVLTRRIARQKIDGYLYQATTSYPMATFSQVLTRRKPMGANIKYWWGHEVQSALKSFEQMPDIFQFGVDSENIDVHTLLYEWPDKLANSDQTVFPIDGEWHSLDEIVE